MQRLLQIFFFICFECSPKIAQKWEGEDKNAIMANRPYKKLAEEFTSVLDKTIGIKVNIERFLSKKNV